MPFSRSYYYVNTNSEFLRKFEVYNNSSLTALKNIEEWMIENRNKTKVKLFKHEIKQVKDKLFCVGVISKERKGINTVIPSVLSLLTRINLKYEDKIDLTLFNVDDDTRRDDLIGLSNLVYIENIINSFGSRIQSYAYNPKVREEADYAAVMKRLHGKKCEYALILEDDSIASWSWYAIYCCFSKLALRSFN